MTYRFPLKRFQCLQGLDIFWHGVPCFRPHGDQACWKAVRVWRGTQVVSGARRVAVMSRHVSLFTMHVFKHVNCSMNIIELNYFHVLISLKSGAVWEKKKPLLVIIPTLFFWIRISDSKWVGCVEHMWEHSRCTRCGTTWALYMIFNTLKGIILLTDIKVKFTYCLLLLLGKVFTLSVRPAVSSIDLYRQRLCRLGSSWSI